MVPGNRRIWFRVFGGAGGGRTARGLTVNATHESQRRTVLLPGGARLTVLGTVWWAGVLGCQAVGKARMAVLRWLPRSFPWRAIRPFPVKASGDADIMTVFFTLTDATGTMICLCRIWRCRLPRVSSSFRLRRGSTIGWCAWPERQSIRGSTECVSTRQREFELRL